MLSLIKPPCFFSYPLTIWIIEPVYHVLFLVTKWEKNYEVAESIKISWQSGKYTKIMLMHKFSPLKALTSKVAYNIQTYTPKDRTFSITHTHLSPKLSYASTDFKNRLHNKQHHKTLIAIEGINTTVVITCLLTFTV